MIRNLILFIGFSALFLIGLHPVLGHNIILRFLSVCISIFLSASIMFFVFVIEESIQKRKEQNSKLEAIKRLINGF